ncbi:MAG TPA: L,D-transpeptidase family protein [Symbiobacteriaceae bacterium]|nr:L,D-transpeptidase family protein [Symbiobacteriaceae bacterium]
MARFRWKAAVAALVTAVAVAVGGQALALAERPQGIGPRAPTPTGVLINIPARTLYWYKDGALVRSFPVGVGKPSSPTPTGRYEVINMLKHPWWYPPSGAAPVDPGPANPLGTRWMGWRDDGYGIHGNNNPDSIGFYVSAGCVRMYRDDVEWLYQQVDVGTPVNVVYEPVQIQLGQGGQAYLAVYEDGYGWGSPDPADVLQAAGYEADAVAVDGPGMYPLTATVAMADRTYTGIWHQGGVYLPVRALGEAVGAEIGWDGVNRQVLVNARPITFVLRGNRAYAAADLLAGRLGLQTRVANGVVYVEP